jgi:type I restriction enzyme S subunit
MSKNTKVAGASSSKASEKREHVAPATLEPLVPELRFREFRGRGEWRHVPLGDHAEILKQRAGTKKYPVMSIVTGVGLISQIEKFGRDISGNSYKNYTVIQKDDFAYNKSATKEFPEGFIAKHEAENKAAVPNSIFTCFRLSSDAIQSEFLYRQLLNNLHGKWLRKFITVGARAHGALSVNTDDLMNLPVPLPAGESSDKEQQKIADCLGSLDDLIAAHSRKLAALQDHKKGLLQQLFPAEGETTPKLRFPEFEEDWSQKKIDDLEPYVTSGSRGWAAYYSNAGDLFVRITNLSRSSIYLNLAKSKYVKLPEASNEGVRTRLREHDILISITADIGIIGYIGASVPLPAYINQHIALVRFNQSKASGKFVSYFLSSERAQENFQGSTDSGTKSGMNLNGIKGIKLFLPSPLEQQKIADCLSALDALITAETEQIAALNTHKKGLMQKLFPNPEFKKA